MNIKTSRSEKYVKKDRVFIEINGAAYLLTETTDGKLEILKSHMDARKETMTIEPRTSNVIHLG